MASGVVDLLSDAQYAGGTVLRRLGDWVSCAFGDSIDGMSGATLVLPADHAALADLTLNSVLRIAYGGEVYEYRVMTIEDSLTGPQVTVTASPLLHDLGFLPLRQITGGMPFYNLAATLLTPTEWLDNFVIPCLHAYGLTHYARGVVEPTTRRSMEWDMETVLEWLRRLVERDGVELTLVRNVGNSTYDITLAAVGEAAEDSVCWVGRNVAALDRHITREGMATSVRPSAPPQTGALERDSAGWVEWDVTGMTDPGSGRKTYTLRNPDGTTAMPPFDTDGEVTGMTARSLCRDWVMPMTRFAGFYTTFHLFSNSMPAWFKSPYETGLFQYRGFLCVPDNVASTNNDRLAIWRMPRILGPGTPQELSGIGSRDFSTGYGLPVVDHGSAKSEGRIFWWTINTNYFLYAARPDASGATTHYVYTGAAPAGLAVSGTFAYRPSSKTMYAVGINNDSKIHKLDTTNVANAWSTFTHGGTNLNGRGIYYHASKDRLYFLTSDRFLRVWNPNTDTEGTALDLTSVFVTANLYQLDMTVQPTAYGNALVVIGYSTGTTGIKIAVIDIASTDAPTLAVSSSEWTAGTGTHAFSGAFYYSPSIDRLLFSYHTTVTGSPTVYHAHVQSWQVTHNGSVYAITQTEKHALGYSDVAAVLYPQKFMEVEGVTYGFSKSGEAWAFAAPDGNHLQRDIFSSTGAEPTITTDPKFPEAYVNNYNTEDTVYNGRVRLASADGGLLTELDDPTAIAAYGRIVREIKAEDYFEDSRTGAVNLLENGPLTRWNTVATDNPKYQYAPLGFSIPDNIDEWHPMLDTAGFPAETAPSVNILVNYAGTYATECEVRLSSGGPLTLRPGDLLYLNASSFRVMVTETVAINSSTYVTVSITRGVASAVLSAAAAVAYTFDRSLLKVWANDRKVLPVGKASTLGSITGGLCTNDYGVARSEFNVTLPSPLPPGSTLYIGGEFLFWRPVNTSIADPHPMIQCYDVPFNNTTPLLTVSQTLALPAVGGTVTAMAEGSWPIVGGRKSLRCCLVSGGIMMFVKSLWAYVAFESKASLMATGYGAGAGAYELYHLGRTVRKERSVPQISYDVQALEDNAEAPFVVGGMTRLVDPLRAIDRRVRIIGWDRALSPGAEGHEFPALKLESREGELTRSLIRRGLI